MAPRLATLPATMVAWVRFSVLVEPTISVEKAALFCVGERSKALQLRVKNKLKICSCKSKGALHLEAWENHIQRQLNLVNGFERYY
jgi:hypothetical protein